MAAVPARCSLRAEPTRGCAELTDCLPQNVADDYSIPDAPLTALGKTQAAALADDAKADVARSQIQLVASSALKRTLQTTLIGWADTVARLGGRSAIAAMPQLQECNDFPCDTGSPRSVLEADQELEGVDLSLLTPDWTSKQGFYAPTPQALQARTEWVRQWLKSRPESTILIVAHGDFLRLLTGVQHPWKNTELQEWSLDTSDSTYGASLQFVRYVTADGAMATTSSDAVDAQRAQPRAGTKAATTAGAPSAAAHSVAELEQRVSSK